MSKTIESLIECPFYISEGTGFVICEGAIKGTTAKQEFKNNSDKAKYEAEVCSVNCGKKCNHYRNVATLYEKGVLS